MKSWKTYNELRAKELRAQAESMGFAADAIEAYPNDRLDDPEGRAEHYRRMQRDYAEMADRYESKASNEPALPTTGEPA
jgi:hypothetical protein